MRGGYLFAKWKNGKYNLEPLVIDFLFVPDSNILGALRKMDSRGLEQFNFQSVVGGFSSTIVLFFFFPTLVSC